jgi:hypothetical protein
LSNRAPASDDLTYPSRRNCEQEFNISGGTYNNWKLEETVPDYFSGIVLMRSAPTYPHSFTALRFQKLFFQSLNKMLCQSGDNDEIWEIFSSKTVLPILTKSAAMYSLRKNSHNIGLKKISNFCTYIKLMKICRKL